LIGHGRWEVELRLLSTKKKREREKEKFKTYLSKNILEEKLIGHKR
jgi:hypothetical protein